MYSQHTERHPSSVISALFTSGGQPNDPMEQKYIKILNSQGDFNTVNTIYCKGGELSIFNSDFSPLVHIQPEYYCCFFF